MASEVVLVQGSTFKISTVEVTDIATFDGSPAVDMAVLDCIGREVSVQGGAAAEIDTTTICSTAKEFRLGLQDNGTMSVNGHWVQGHPAHEVIKAAAADKLSRGIQVVFSDGSEFRCLAFVQQRSWSAAVDGVVTASYTFRLTGATVEIAA